MATQYQSNESSTDLIQLVQNKDYEMILCNLHQDFGPNMCFLVQVTKMVKKNIAKRTGVIAISSFKPRENVTFNDALRSTQLGYLWTDPSQRSVIDKYCNKSVTIELTADEEKIFQQNKSEREALYDWISKNKSLKANWIRVVFSTQPWPRDLVTAVNEYNKENEYTPVVLIMMTDKLFGIEAKERLTAEELIQILQDPMPNLTFIDHTISMNITNYEK